MKTNPASLPLSLPLFSTALLATLVAICGAGCGKTDTAKEKPAPAANTPPPAGEAILTAWEQGDSAGAVQQFVEADWGARPLFAPGSVMNLSEAQFKRLPVAQREVKAAEVQAQLASLKKLAGAVAQAGREAAAKNDVALARKHFTALDQFGGAVDEPDSMLIVKLVGQALKKMALAEAAKLPQ
jgi:hypothetical protein